MKQNPKTRKTETKNKSMNVYLDNGGTTKVDDEVTKDMLVYFKTKYGNASSLHEFGTEANIALQVARKTIADKINALPEEIIFTSGGTEADNLAIKGVAYANKKKGNIIITSQFEHPAVLNMCKELEKEGFKIIYLNVSREGFVDFNQLKNEIKKYGRKIILVSIMHANNEIGTIQPIKEIGEYCRQNNILFHTDAVQSFTKTKIDVQEMKIDLLSLSAHKIHGPKGVGALYLRKGTELQKQSFGGHHEFNLRAGTENIPGIVGFAKAANIANEENIKKMTNLRNYLIDSLLKLPNTQLNGSKENRLCNNANIAFNFVEGESLLLYLNQGGIAVSTGSACSSKSLEPSHVLLSIGLKHETAHGCIRFTLSKYTTKEEIDYTLKKVRVAVEKLRKLSPLNENVKYTAK
jgi:cysteine desulfurase